MTCSVVLLKGLQLSFVEQVNANTGNQPKNLKKCVLIAQGFLKNCFGLNGLFSTVTTEPPSSLLHAHTHTHIHPHRCQSWPPTVGLHSVAFSPCNPRLHTYPASKCQQHTHTNSSSLMQNDLVRLCIFSLCPNLFAPLLFFTIPSSLSHIVALSVFHCFLISSLFVHNTYVYESCVHVQN